MKLFDLPDPEESPGQPGRSASRSGSSTFMRKIMASAMLSCMLSSVKESMAWELWQPKVTWVLVQCVWHLKLMASGLYHEQAVAGIFQGVS